MNFTFDILLGLLSSRGVIEKCERQYLSNYQRENLCRKEKWKTILKANKKLKRIFRRLDFETSNEDQKIEIIASKITLIYSFISDQIHNSYNALISLKIGHEFTQEQAVIIASICNRLNIKWESSVISNNFKPIALNEII